MCKGNCKGNKCPLNKDFEHLQYLSYLDIQDLKCSGIRKVDKKSDFGRNEIVYKGRCGVNEI